MATQATAVVEKVRGLPFHQYETSKPDRSHHGRVIYGFARETLRNHPALRRTEEFVKTGLAISPVMSGPFFRTLEACRKLAGGSARGAAPPDRSHETETHPARVPDELSPCRRHSVNVLATRLIKRPLLIIDLGDSAMLPVERVWHPCRVRDRFVAVLRGCDPADRTPG
jgi:hypothetical protein